MDEEVLNDLFERAVSQGYTKSIEDFATLIATDQEVLEDSYSYAVDNGYPKSIYDFSTLVGVKKKEDTELPLESGLLEPTTLPTLPESINVEQMPQTASVTSEDLTVESGYVSPDLKMDILDLAIQLPTFNYKELNPEGQKYIDDIASTYNLTKDQVLAQALTKKVAVNRSGVTDLWANSLKMDEARIMEGIASIPSVIYEAAALVSDPINRALGLPETDLKAFEEALGVDTVLESLIKEQEFRGKQAELFKQGKGIEGGVFDNFAEGNFEDGFILLGEGIAGSAATSIGIMLASASGVGLIPLAGGATTVLTGPELRAQKEKFPEQSDAVNMLKAVGMAGADMFFTTISQGTLGRVYKDILLKEGVKQGRKTFKEGLIAMYETALKKYGAVTSSLGEGIEEVATQITQNLIDGRPVFEGVADAFLIGFGSGGVYGAPINAAKGFQAVNEAVAKTKINKKIKPTEFSDIVQVFESAETNELQFDLAKTKRADAILVNELKRRVDRGEMTQKEADRIQKNFFDTSIIQVKLDKTNLNQEQKIQATNLLKEKEALTQIIEEVGDPSLTVAQQTRVDEINEELANLSTITETIKTDKDAIQEQSTEEVDVQEQARDGEDVGTGDIVIDETTRETTPQEEEVGVEDTETEEEVSVEEVEDLEYALGIPKKKDLKDKKEITQEQALKNLREKQKALRDLEAQINPDGPGSPSTIALNDARRDVDDAKAELSKLIKTPIAEQVTEEQVTEETPGTVERFFGETIEETTEKVSDNLVVNRKEAPADKTSEQLKREQSVLRIATTAAKAISKLLPNTRIVIHDSTTDFQNFVSDAQAESEFNPSENVIHVDLSKATEITVPHEVFHAVFLNKVKTDNRATRQADLLVKKLKGNVPKKVQQEIDAFVAKYEGAPEVQNEERLAELMGILARDYTNLEAPAQNFIKTFLKTLARAFGLRDIESSFNSENDVVKLLQTLARKVKTGEEITDVDVEILEEGTEATATPRQRKATVEQVAQQYNMDNQGFIPKTANLSQLRRAVEPFGLGAQRARVDQFGRGGGLFLTRNGRKFNPFAATPRRRVAPIEAQDLTIEGIIKAGREQGFSDPAIRAVLKGRGFKASEINPAMELALGKNEVLPAAFQNIEQGAQEGLKLFRNLQSKLKEYTTQAERTKAETRAKALELLQETEVYQALPEISQNELVLALDSSIGTRANRAVQQEISKIKKAVRGYKKGIADLRKAQIELKNFIRNILPVSKTYTQADIARNIAIISNVKSKQDLPAAVEKVLKNVETKRDRLKKSLIKRILTSAKKKAKARIGITRKVKAKGLDVRGQQFFKSAVEILENILLNQVEQVQTSIDELANKIDATQTTDQVIDSVFEKDARGEKLSTQETKLIDYILARNLFSEINTMSLEDVQQLEETLNQITKESISKLKQDRQLVAEENRKIKDEVNEAIASNYEVLTETDSEGNVVFKDKEVLDEEQREVWDSFRKFKIWDGLKKMSKYYQFTGVPVIYDYFRKKLAHLGSLTKILDKYQEGFFYKNIYDKLNVMSENALRGIYNQKDILDDLANSIPGITNGYREISEKLFKGPIVIERTVDGKKRKRTFSANELLRIYALSLNEVQREKLKSDGFDDKVLSRIEKELGPELTAFADNVVEYLSTSYFESVNDVYSSLNFTNLGYVENYFPTRTKTKLDSTLLEDGNFNAIFGAENSPALKARTDLKSKIVIDEGDTFTSVLDNHIESMERFKSYAKGVRQMNAIFNAEGVQSLLYVTGLRNLIKQSINFEVNPDYGYSNMPNTIISKLNTKFTSFALAFRVIQIAKQATSFINAFEKYQFRPGKSTPVLDTLGFLADLSVVIATLPKQIKKAYKLSATFRDRIEKGLGGDVVGLESGAKLKALPKDSPLISKARQAFRTAGAAPTVLGDVIGVMGYMVNYNRNIKNGMSEKEALKVFNDYNATQQSRRNTDKIPLQRSKSELTRAFTMFGSTLFLQINKVAIAQAAIMSKAKAGKFKQIKAEELRAFALNLGVANALFVLTANIARLINGDDEDKEEVLREVNKALVGANLIYQVPLIGAAAEMAVARAEGKSGSYASSVVNPYLSIYRKVNRYYETIGTEGAVIPLIELGLGAQIDPLVGLYNAFEGMGTFEEDDMYDILGISPSYRPRKRPKPKAPPKVEF